MAMEIVLKDNIKRRNRTNGRFRYLIIAGAVVTIIPIFLIVGNLAAKGYRQINAAFFTEPAPDTFQAMMAASSGEVIPGGIANGLTGSLLMVLAASLLAIPLGLMTGIYLYENRTRRYAGIIRSLTEILQGVPSVILGIIAYLWIVKNITRGYSALAGSVALMIMMLPLIIRSTEETMMMIPVTIKRGGICPWCALLQDDLQDTHTCQLQWPGHRRAAGTVKNTGRDRTTDAYCTWKPRNQS